MDVKDLELDDYKIGLIKIYDALKDVLEQVGGMDSCDCGGSSLCSICYAQQILNEIEEEFDL